MGGKTTAEVRILSTIRAFPSDERPRLAPEVEERLAQLEERAARRYSALELLAFRARQLAARLRGEGTASPELVEQLDTLRGKIEVK